MAIRRLRVLGTLALDAPAVSAVLRTRKAVALLTFLALQSDRRARRDQLAHMFWPRVESDAARTSLRQLLAGLRKARAEHAPLLDADSDWLALAGDVEVDAIAFQAAAARDDVAGAAEAVSLYRGALLADGLAVDSTDFDDWLDQERARLCRIAVAAMERVAATAIEGAFDRAEGLAAAERAVGLDPYNEQAHRQLMALQAANGRPDLALLHYAALADTLRRDLQVAPDPETQALHARLRGERRPQRAVAPIEAEPIIGVRAETPPVAVPPRPPTQRRIGAYAPAALIGVAAALLVGRRSASIAGSRRRRPRPR